MPVIWCHFYTVIMQMLYYCMECVNELVSEWVCRVSHSTQHIIGHFGDESFQAIDCTGADNQTTTKMKHTKHKNKLALVKTQKHTETHPYKSPILKQLICKNCSYQRAYDCAQLQLCYAVEHRRVLIIFPLIFQSIIVA